MNYEAFIAGRLVFHLKADARVVNPLRHDILVRNGLIYRHSRIAKPDYAMAIEAQVVDTVLENGGRAIPIKVTTDEKGTYQWMRRARGQEVAELPVEEKRKAWLELAPILRKLHEIRGTGAGLIVGTDPLVGGFPSWALYILTHVDFHLLYCASEGLLETPQTRVICDKLIDWSEGWDEKTKLSLLHGDLNDWNLFAEGGRLSDIIDWEDALIGDPIFELAGWACFTSRAQEDWSPFLKAYYGGKEPEGFWPTFWIYYLRVALARLVYLHRYYPTLDLTMAKGRVELALEELK